MLGVLPPVGDAVLIRPQPGELARLCGRWLPYRPRFFASGTAALAAALMAVVRVSGRQKPEVILPGYGCPALVSAVVHAGAVPVYADLERERPWMSLGAVHDLICASTVAVVAVNLLGIPERIQALRELVAGRGIALIEDSAQAFPQAPARDGADLVVLSFGRGKPVSVLGGGAVLARDEGLAAALPEPPQTVESLRRLRVKAAIYNLLRQPACYWLPQMLPLGLGETRYQSLAGVDAMGAKRIDALPAAVDAYLARPRLVERRIRDAVRETGGGSVLDLAHASGITPDDRLLRYPLLARDGQTRDALVRDLKRFGASKMYAAVLPRVEGVPPFRSATLTNAEQFASRLFTLPVHDGVASGHIVAMRSALERVEDGLRLEMPKPGKIEESI